MPPNTLQVHTEYVLVKSCGRSQLKPRVQGAGEYSPPVPCLNFGSGDRWCSHLLKRSPNCIIGSGNTYIASLREFNRAKSYCHLYDAQG
ncbi:hypothetical protein TNCV_4927011 [Trichonephila clavipes]|nr:hypothetical protein TNCV_4927011 [Trichonephila clavipes]